MEQEKWILTIHMTSGEVRTRTVKGDRRYLRGVMDRIIATPKVTAIYPRKAPDGIPRKDARPVNLDAHGGALL